MTEPNETIRRSLVQQINGTAGNREVLEAQHGQVWDTQELKPTSM